MDREALAAEIVCKLFLDRRIGGRHLNEQAVRTGLAPELRGPPFEDAMRWLAGQGWLLYHAKGRPGKDDNVSLEPSRIAEILRFARDHLPPERLERLANSLPEHRRARLLGAGGPPRQPPGQPLEARAVTRGELLRLLEAYAPSTMLQELRRDFGQRLAALEAQGHAASPREAGLERALEALRRDVQALQARVEALARKRAPAARAPAKAEVPVLRDALAEATRQELKKVALRIAILEAWMESQVPEARRHFFEDAGAAGCLTGATLDPGEAEACAHPGCSGPAEHAAPRLRADGAEWAPEGIVGLCERHRREALLVVGRGDVARFRALARRVPEAWTPCYVAGEEGPARRFLAALEAHFPGARGDGEALWIEAREPPRPERPSVAREAPSPQNGSLDGWA